MMYKTPTIRQGSIQINESTEGETIETKIEMMMENKEPMGRDGAPIIFTERREGVKPSYNIRTDRFDVALEAMDKVNASYAARREERQAEKETKVIDLNNGKTESTQGTGE